MVKEMKKYTVMALAALMLVGGVTVAANKSNHIISKKAMADITETTPDDSFNDTVVGEEEVPL